MSRITGAAPTLRCRCEHFGDAAVDTVEQEFSELQIKQAVLMRKRAYGKKAIAEFDARLADIRREHASVLNQRTDQAMKLLLIDAQLEDIGPC